MCAPDVIENQDCILRLTKETMPLVSLAALRAQKSVYVTCMITELPLSRSSEVQRENTIHMWEREIYKLNLMLLFQPCTVPLRTAKWTRREQYSSRRT